MCVELISVEIMLMLHRTDVELGLIQRYWVMNSSIVAAVLIWVPGEHISENFEFLKLNLTFIAES